MVDLFVTDYLLSASENSCESWSDTISSPDEHVTNAELGLAEDHFAIEVGLYIIYFMRYNIMIHMK